MPTPTSLNYNPDLPVYAAPEDEFQQAEVQKQNIDDFIDPAKATVEGRVTNLATSGNPLLERYRQMAIDTHNARGLADSRGAVAAGTGAVLDKAIEIATPDAALFGEAGKMNLKAANDAALNNQVAKLDYNKMQTQGKITGALTQQDYAGKFALQKLTDEAQMQRVQLDNEWKNYLQNAQLSSQEKQQLVGVTQQLGDSLNGAIERIMRDTNVSNKQAAIEAIMTQYKTQLNTAAAMVGVQLSWS